MLTSHNTEGTAKNAEVFVDCRNLNLKRVPTNIDESAYGCSLYLNKESYSTMTLLRFIDVARVQAPTMRVAPSA
jgi:hypothetical protein